MRPVSLCLSDRYHHVGIQSSIIANKKGGPKSALKSVLQAKCDIHKEHKEHMETQIEGGSRATGVDE